MIKIWVEVFWKDHPEKNWKISVSKNNKRLLPVNLLAFFAILLGIAGGPLFDICLRAGEQLTDSSGYIQAVLGENP